MPFLISVQNHLPVEKEECAVSPLFVKTLSHVLQSKAKMMGWPCVKDFQGSFVASEHESLHVFAGRSSRLIALALFNKLQNVLLNNL